MKTPMNEPITMFKKQFNFLSMAVHPFPNSDFSVSKTGIWCVLYKFFPIHSSSFMESLFFSSSSLAVA